MKGKYHIVVQNNKLRYELDIRRNITAPNLHGQILFLDEENRFVKSKTARIS